MEKEENYDELYEGLDTREGEMDLYWLTRQRSRCGMCSKIEQWKMQMVMC